MQLLNGQYEKGKIFQFRTVIHPGTEQAQEVTSHYRLVDLIHTALQMRFRSQSRPDVGFNTVFRNEDGQLESQFGLPDELPIDAGLPRSGDTAYRVKCSNAGCNAGWWTLVYPLETDCGYTCEKCKVLQPSF